MSRLASRVVSFDKREVQALFRRIAKRIYKAGLDIRIAPALYSYGRLLIIVPKKVGNAPQRNRIKRRLRALFYKEKFYTLLKDVIIVVRPEAAALSFMQLEAVLKEVLT